MNKFNVEIKQEHSTYYLSTTRNGYQWTSMIVENPEQMRRIARALIAKADEIEIGKAELDQSDIEELKALLRDGKKIAAIRLAKNLTGWPLVPSKKYIDALEKKING